jgi:hypothetical protein
MQLIETPKAKETREYRMLVGGEWVEALSSKTFESVNPYTGLVRELLVRHPLAGSAATPVYAVDTSVWPDATRSAAPSEHTTTLLPATRLGSPSWPDGPTSSSHS